MTKPFLMSAYKDPSIATLKALETVPSMLLILSPSLHILTASDLYLEATQTKRERIIGQFIFDAAASFHETLGFTPHVSLTYITK